nr:BTAD domain-containing putative transcriptional regulator [Herbihabitans rhizosphaerae]
MDPAAGRDCADGWSYFLLGSLRVEFARTRWLSLGPPQERAMLIALLLDANRVVTVDQLVEGLWDDEPPTSARARVQDLISRLRRKMCEVSERIASPIQTVGAGYRIVVGAGQLDLDRARNQIGSARVLLTGGQPLSGVRLMRATLQDWEGTVQPELTAPIVRRADTWLSELRLAAMEDCIDAELSLSQHQRLVPELVDLVQRHPLREKLRAALMIALAKSGRVADALLVYNDWRHLLVTELGVEPTPRMRELHTSILDWQER